MGNIYHTWQGTTLVITSDSGTSSCDLKGDIGIRGPQGPASHELTLDTELSSTSENPVQNKVINEALDGKLDKFEPKYNNTAVIWYVLKNAEGSLYSTTREISASVKADVIPITGAGGALRVGNPTADAHATPKKYVDDKTKRYKHTITFTNDLNRKVILITSFSEPLENFTHTFTNSVGETLTWTSTAMTEEQYNQVKKCYVVTYDSVYDDASLSITDGEYAEIPTKMRMNFITYHFMAVTEIQHINMNDNQTTDTVTEL